MQLARRAPRIYGRHHRPKRLGFWPFASSTAGLLRWNVLRRSNAQKQIDPAAWCSKHRSSSNFDAWLAQIWVDLPLAGGGQPAEGSGVHRGRDHQYVAYAGKYQRRQWVVDHWLVVDRQQLLASPTVIGCSRDPVPPAKMIPRTAPILSGCANHTRPTNSRFGFAEPPRRYLDRERVSVRNRSQANQRSSDGFRPATSGHSGRPARHVR